MNILVTGGAGFIGSHLTDALIEAGHHVIVVDNLSTGSRKNLNSKAVFYEWDIMDQEKLAQVFDHEHIDIVFHEAAQTMVPFSMTHPREDADLNILGLLNVLENCRRCQVKKVMFSSSAAVYGDNLHVPLREDEPVAPTSFYGLTKVIAERYLQMYHDVFGLEYAVLRYSNVYGERQGSHGEGGVVYVFSQAIAQGKGLTIFGDGNQSRDFVYVKDIARANIAAMDPAVPSGIYNISTAIETTVNALKEILQYFSGQAVDVTYEGARSGDIYRSALDRTKARDVLKWRPVTKLLPGLQSTFSYFLEEESH